MLKLFRLLCLCVVLVACATSPPVQEMSDARQAIAAAREAGAQQYAPEELAEAEQLLAAAEHYLKAGTSTGYWNAGNAAVSAKETALEALLKSRTAREQAE